MTKACAFVTPLSSGASITNAKVLGSGMGTVCGKSSTLLLTSRSRRSRQMRVPTTAPTMGLFGLGLPEILVIAGVSILVFGPGKIAELGKDLGGIAGGVKKASSEFKDAMADSLEEADREIEAKRVVKEDKEVLDKDTDSMKSADITGGGKPDS